MKTIIEVSGWKAGLIAYDLIQFIKTERKLKLAEARDIAHAIVDNKKTSFEFDSVEEAMAFAKGLEQLGVIIVA